MGKYLLRRFLNYLVLVIIATTITYFLAASYLDPREAKFNCSGTQGDRAVCLENARKVLAKLHLNPDENIFSRFGYWAKRVVAHWDWGFTPGGGHVNAEVAGRVWVSFRLVTIGFILGAAIGVLLGAWAATKQYKMSDKLFTLWSLLVISTPTAVIAVTLQILATKVNRASGWPVFEFLGETGRRGDAWYSPLADRLQHLLLPTITLTLLGIASYSRYQRNLMLDTLNADYVRTARAKGLRRRKAVFKHALRTALIPTGTLFAIGIPGVFVGATFTETIFGWHGMGEYFIQSLQKQDVNGVVAVTAFSAVAYLVGAVLAEIFVVILDPRVRVA